MKGHPIIIMVRDKSCMVSVTIKDVHQKRIAGLSDNERSEIVLRINTQLSLMLASIRKGQSIGRH